MKTTITAVTSILALAVTLQAAEYHVSVKGKDSNTGTQDAPFCTIQHAADLAQPGDTITVHEGVYREHINPPRGGQSPDKRITYQAATGEKVEIKGSEVIKNWTKVQDDTWKVVLPNTFFGSFNPYQDLIKGDWFNPKGREHHTGAVYLNGDWLTEAANLDEVMKPIGDTPLWFGQVDKENTTIWAQFKGSPNEQQVEINARQAIFYPDKPGRDYITVRGFMMRHAATPWAPPTAEQIGLIGTHWSKGWIIENNVISHSVCTGITLGKHGDQYDNTSANTAEGYVKTIERAKQPRYDKLTTDQLNKSVQDSVGKMQQSGWSKENIGHHVVRDNTISHCEQAGIVGSLGAIFSTVRGNVIHDIHVRRLFTGAEQAGIKFHAAIDVEISRNHIYRTSRGLWLDWMAQGTRVTSNLLHDNLTEDVFVEVDHGPFLLDNNILLSKMSVRDMSQGGAYVHNLIAGHVKLNPDKKRLTPFHKAHSTEIAGLKTIVGGDDRFCNNIFVGSVGLSEYDSAELPVWMDGNVFFNGAKPSKFETNPLVKTDFDPAIKLTEKADGSYIEFNPGPLLADERTRKLVTTELLGKAAIPDVPYDQPDGTPIRVSTDYFGEKRRESNPMPGPFESLGKAPSTSSSWRVWPPADTQPAQDLGLIDQADFGRVVTVGSANKEDEFPAIGSDDDGNIWVCWVAYDGNADAVLAARIDGQRASPPVVLSETTGDHWLPAMCKDGQGRLWATWTRGDQGKWDIWGKYLSAGKWSDAIRLTRADGNDFCQKLAVDKAGTLWMTWQSVVDGNYEIMLTTITPEGQANY